MVEWKRSSLGVRPQAVVGSSVQEDAIRVADDDRRSREHQWHGSDSHPQVLDVRHGGTIPPALFFPGSVPSHQPEPFACPNFSGKC
jgi:hypothetical protein